MPFVLAQDIVEQLGDGVGDGEEEVHHAEDKGGAGAAYLETVSDAHLCFSTTSTSVLLPRRWVMRGEKAYSLRDDLAKDDNHGCRHHHCGDTTAEDCVEKDGK